ncbi:ethyl tert-butyl ether degradation EthD [Mesorhizobium sp. LNHC252B00]|nr:ethyl tert-butyl ether degradation EthD [Mesorhizobium sp. LNHC252B00]
MPVGGHPKRRNQETSAMIIRYALFEGEIHAGRESEFRRFVRERLVPLWTQFPGAEEVRVLDGTARDDGAPVYAMALAIRYPDMDTCSRALQSDVRFQSRDVTGELLKMFTGRVHHHVFEANEYSTAR